MVFLWTSNCISKSFNVTIDAQLTTSLPVSILFLCKVFPVVQLIATGTINSDVRWLHCPVTQQDCIPHLDWLDRHLMQITLAFLHIKLDVVHSIVTVLGQRALRSELI